jgi:hypothetical protein
MMPALLPKVFRAVSLAAILFSLSLSAATTGEISATVASEQGRIHWSYKGNKLFTYAFASDQFKPYVQSLYTLQGEDVLRDAPADHLHHHGLMYAIRVNGVNFWEEQNQPGRQRPVKLIEHSTGKSEAGLPQASFTQLIHWVRHADRALPDTAPAALLIERRTITVTVDEPRQEIALRWQAEFEAGPAAERAKLEGSDYNGLGLRLPAAWDHVARHSNSEKSPYSKEQRWDLTPARWAAVSNKVKGHDITVTLFGHPGNRGEPRFFSMLDAFAYLAVTQNLSKEPIEYARGEKFRIDYLMLVYTGQPGSEQLERRYGRWLTESAAE